MEENENYLKLPVRERCCHKSWKARLSGYEDALKLFKSWEGDDPGWGPFSPLIKKFVIDGNIVAQEKGLEAALAFFEDCFDSQNVANECLDGLVNKCMGLLKPKAKEITQQIILTLIEVEAHETVIEHLIKGLSQKNPKIVAGCINTMTSCLNNFGAKVMRISSLIKGITPLFGHKDKTVRDECKKFIVEAYRWIGDSIRQQLEKLKPVQITELETEFSNTKIGDSKPLRFLKSVKQSEVDEDQQGLNCQQVMIDPYDLLEPVDVLMLLPKTFYEQIEAKDWRDRQEALKSLLKAVNSPRIQNGDFTKIVKVLKVIIEKDSNVSLVTLAAQCSTFLANGLRKDFKEGVLLLLPIILEKFKEKKSNVVLAVRDTVDSFYKAIGIELVKECCIRTLNHGTPSVVSETAKFLSRCIISCPPPLVLNKELLTEVVQALVIAASHSNSLVRESAFEALGALLKVVGEKRIMKLLSSIDDLKLKRINEIASSIVLKGASLESYYVKNKSEEGPNCLDSKSPGKSSKPPIPTKPLRRNVKNEVQKQKLATKETVVKTNVDSVSITKAILEQIITKSTEYSMPDLKPTVLGRVSKKLENSSSMKNKGGNNVNILVKTPKNEPKSKENIPNFEQQKVEAAKNETIQNEIPDVFPPYVVNSLKEKRFQERIASNDCKISSLTTKQQMFKLRESMHSASFHPRISEQLFSNNSSQISLALDRLSHFVMVDSKALIANLDLILIWSAIQITNTSDLRIQNKLLEYLEKVFSVLKTNVSFGLHHLEALDILPCLISKLDDTKKGLGEKIRRVLKLISLICPANRIYFHLSDAIRANKSTQVKNECLKLTHWLLTERGLVVFHPSPKECLEQIKKHAFDSNHSTREAALKVMNETYFLFGVMAGSLPKHDVTILDQTFNANLSAPCSTTSTVNTSTPITDIAPIFKTPLPPKLNKNRLNVTAGCKASKEWQTCSTTSKKEKKSRNESKTKLSKENMANIDGSTLRRQSSLPVFSNFIGRLVDKGVIDTQEKVAPSSNVSTQEESKIALKPKYLAESKTKFKVPLAPNKISKNQKHSTLLQSYPSRHNIQFSSTKMINKSRGDKSTFANLQNTKSGQTGNLKIKRESSLPTIIRSKQAVVAKMTSQVRLNNNMVPKKSENGDNTTPEQETGPKLKKMPWDSSHEAPNMKEIGNFDSIMATETKTKSNKTSKIPMPKSTRQVCPTEYPTGKSL